MAKYEAIDVANYVINRSIELEKPVSNLTLQKILYYIQAAFLIKTEKPAFKEEILAWRYGPVIPEVYKEYKCFFGEEILYKVKNKKDYCDREYDPFDIISKKDSNLIDKVIESKNSLSAFELVDKTHEESPWKDAERNEVITRDSIKEYFREHESRLFE